MVLVYYISFYPSLPLTANNQLKDLVLNSPNFAWEIRKYDNEIAFVLFEAMPEDIPSKGPYCFKKQTQVNQYILFDSRFICKKQSV